MKYLGMAMVFLSCTAGGFYFSGKTAVALAQAERFLSFFDYISEKLNVYKTPIEKIFSSYRDSLLEECGFLGALRQMGRSGGVYANPWESALAECRKNGGLKIGAEEYACICEFGSRLCSENGTERRRFMESGKTRLLEVFAKKSEKASFEAKMYKISGGLIGILVCLLFI